MHRVLCLLLAVHVISCWHVKAQGTIIYRTGAEMVTQNTLVDMNHDGIVEFDFRNREVAGGLLIFRLHTLSPNTLSLTSSDYAGEILGYTTFPREIEWMSGQPILPNPGSDAHWTGVPLDLSFFLAAVRIRGGRDWHYGWLGFERSGEDEFGELWTLRDGAYNSIPNASINMLQVPEPATWVLIACGVAALALHRRGRDQLW